MIMKPRVVVCAAIKNKFGKIVCGARHWDNIMRGQILIAGKRPLEWIAGVEQGFIDQYGVFMSREEAYILAKEMGQIKYGREYSKGTLYSEDLY